MKALKPNKQVTKTKKASLRKRAESLLAKQKERLRELSSTDLKKLVHELGTHQIELEMQNEELRRAQGELETSRARYADLYDFAPVGYFTFDAKGLIKEVNLTGAGMLGVAKLYLLDKPVLSHIDPAHRAIFRNHLREVFQTKISATCEVTIRKKDGTSFHAQLNSLSFAAGDGDHGLCRTAISDITERKRAETALKELNTTLEQRVVERAESLRQSERKFYVIFDKAGFAAVLSRLPDGEISDVNEAWVKMFGYSKKEARGKTTSELNINPETEVQTRIITQLQERGSVHDQELTLRTKSGEQRVFSTNVDLVEMDAQKYILSTLQDITGRKRAEESLRESEERLRLAHRAANIGAFEWNVQTGVNVWTPQLETMYDLARGKFGKTQPAWEQLVHPEDRAAAVGLVDQAFETGDPVDGEWRIVWRDGSVHWIAGRFQAFKDAAGKPLRLSGLNMDITQRKLAEESLRQSEEQFRTLADSIPNLAWWANADGYITWYNRRWYEYTGTTPEQMEGWGWQSVHDPKVLPKVLERWKASIATGLPFDMEFPLRGADGVFRSFLTRVQPLKDSAGLVLRWFGTNTDISALKLVEEALRQSEERFRSYFELGLIGMAITSPAKGTIEVNEKICEILGYERSELLQLTWTELTHGDDLAADVAHFNRVLAGEIDGYTIDKRFIRKNGDIVYATISVKCVRTADGSVDFFVALLQDITERKQAEEALKAAHAELKRRAYELYAVNRELEAFAYTVSHDLKAPLRGIEGFTRAIVEDYSDKLDDPGRDYLRRVIAASQRMTQLIDAMLNMARLTRGELHEKVVDLSALAHVVAHDLQKQEPDRQVAFVIADKVTVSGDRTMLQVMIENLMHNAWKFTGNHKSARIEFGKTDMKGKVVYFVRDDGVGFDMQFTDKLFRPFMRLHKETEFPGIGIGLAIVNRIITRHGGRIWAESALEKGATFYFTL